LAVVSADAAAFALPGAAAGALATGAVVVGAAFVLAAGSGLVVESVGILHDIPGMAKGRGATLTRTHMDDRRSRSRSPWPNVSVYSSLPIGYLPG